MSPIPSTKYQEERRKQSLAIGRSTLRAFKRSYGTIKEVHPEFSRRIRVTLDDGVDIRGGNYIPLLDSPLDIAQRFGAVRPGMRVLVTAMGEPEQEVTAVLIGDDQEGASALLLDPNLILTPDPLHSMFI